MKEPLLLTRGLFVKITADYRTVDAMVTLASPNGQSLMVMFDAMLLGYVGMMPIVWTENGYVDLIRGEPVQIEVKDRDGTKATD